MTGPPATTRTSPPPGTPPPASSGRRSTALDLRPLPGAVPSARLHARTVVHEWGMPALASDAELIVSELLTNAIRAAAAITLPGGPPPVRLRLTERASGVQVEIWDASDQMPRPGPAGPHHGEGGRGLLIVAALAARHGAYPTAGGGKCTWAILTAPPPAGGSRQEEDDHRG